MASILKVDTLQLPDGSTPTAADLGIDVAGSVVQQVEYYTTDQWNTTSSTYSPTNLSVSITPKYADSKMLIMVFASTHYDGANDHGRGQIRKNGNTMAGQTDDDLLAYLSSTTAKGETHSSFIVDPNVGTTNPVTYAYYAKSGSSQNFYFYRNQCIVVQEIAQ